MSHDSLDRRAMAVLHKSEMLQTVCKESRRWGMYIRIHVPDDTDVIGVLEAASFLDMDMDAQVIADEEGWILFNSEEGMRNAFDSCVGDEGPTRLNPYNGRVRVYALTCSSEGMLLDENT